MTTATATPISTRQQHVQLALVQIEDVEDLDIVVSRCHECRGTIQDLTLRVFCDPCLNV